SSTTVTSSRHSAHCARSFRRFLPSPIRPPLRSTLFPYTTLFRSQRVLQSRPAGTVFPTFPLRGANCAPTRPAILFLHGDSVIEEDRKSTRLNSSHGSISYAVFCLKKKTKTTEYEHQGNTGDDEVD